MLRGPVRSDRCGRDACTSRKVKSTNFKVEARLVCLGFRFRAINRDEFSRSAEVRCGGPAPVEA
jgi:hypothetical protein